MINVDNVRIEGLDEVSIPKFIKIQQSIPDEKLSEDLIPNIVRDELIKSEISTKVKPGNNVAIAVGSRGIDKLPVVVKAVVDYLKEIKCNAFIVPAMGSHGGATAGGQTEILESYGITEEKMNVPMHSSMEVVQIGTSKSGLPIYFDKIAHESDGIIIVNRVKVHTNFSGDHESGILKMLAIGLGKHKGCAEIHKFTMDEYFPALIPKIGQEILALEPILAGVGLLENGWDHLCGIKAWAKDQIIEGEKIMLKKQKNLLPRIPFDDVDILVVNQIGKDISGAGLDPNIIGVVKPISTRIGAIIVLDLTENTHGSAVGIGYADYTTLKCFSKIDFNPTYTNTIAARELRFGKIPIVLKTGELALKTAMLLTNKPSHEINIVRIQNTLMIHEIWVSESMKVDVERDSALKITSENLSLEWD